MPSASPFLTKSYKYIYFGSRFPLDFLKVYKNSVSLSFRGNSSKHFINKSVFRSFLYYGKR